MRGDRVLPDTAAVLRVTLPWKSQWIGKLLQIRKQRAVHAPHWLSTLRVREHVSATNPGSYTHSQNTCLTESASITNME